MPGLPANHVIANLIFGVFGISAKQAGPAHEIDSLIYACCRPSIYVVE